MAELGFLAIWFPGTTFLPTLLPCLLPCRGVITLTASWLLSTRVFSTLCFSPPSSRSSLAPLLPPSIFQSSPHLTIVLGFCVVGCQFPSSSLPFGPWTTPTGSFPLRPSVLCRTQAQRLRVIDITEDKGLESHQVLRALFLPSWDPCEAPLRKRQVIDGGLSSFSQVNEQARSRAVQDWTPGSRAAFRWL